MENRTVLQKVYEVYGDRKKIHFRGNAGDWNFRTLAKEVIDFWRTFLFRHFCRFWLIFVYKICLFREEDYGRILVLLAAEKKFVLNIFWSNSAARKCRVPRNAPFDGRNAYLLNHIEILNQMAKQKRLLALA